MNSATENLIGKRVMVTESKDAETETVRYGTIVDALSKQETRECMMYGQLIKARMDDTGKDEEFTYGWDLAI